ncbi:MAG: B12-binding domain-containing radical SAM protein [Lachnospiraceae bacterium]|nr:B12-binding domain-containing radical SAM protein [Lachnospiraceae bacterium]
MRILLIAVNAKYIHSNPAVYSLSQYARDAADGRDIEFQIAEYTINNRIDEIIPDIYNRKPDVAAFSVYIWNVEYVTMLASALKKIVPQIGIWAGGPEVSYRAEQFLNDNPAFDLVMCGEGERLFSSCANSYFDGERPAGIFRCEEPLTMDDIPFIYGSLSDYENKIIYYETSRGCPFSCSYCLSSIDKTTRYRSIDIVKEELSHFIDGGVKLVKFVDRTFNANRRHALDIWKYIAEHDRGITTFHCELSAGLISDVELDFLAGLRKGLLQFEIGIQTFNKKTLVEINRNCDLDRLCHVVRRLHDAGNIHLHLDLIAGLPYEGIDSFADSFNRVYALSPDEFQLGFLKVLSGSEMALRQQEYAIVKSDYPPYEVMSTKWLTYDDILLLKRVEKVLEIYYNSRQFDKTISYIMGFFCAPFNMYKELGDCFDKEFDTGVSHSRLTRYEFLYNFGKRYVDDGEFLRELLVYDIYLRENCNTRPPYAEPGNDYTHRFCRGKKLSRKRYHVEYFNYDIKEYIDSGRINKCGVLYIFDYENRDIITHNVIPERCDM